METTLVYLVLAIFALIGLAFVPTIADHLPERFRPRMPRVQNRSPNTNGGPGGNGGGKCDASDGGETAAAVAIEADRVSRPSFDDT